jgi:hypothetical protein
MRQSGEFDEEDLGLLDAAEAWLRGADSAELQGDWPCRLSATRGIDFATAALYRFVCSHSAFPDLSEGTADEQGAGDTSRALRDVTVAVVPGAFYREHPTTGADGAAIRSAASELGCRTALISTASIGTLAANANDILAWLDRRTNERVILISLSKGGADVKVALSHPDAQTAFGSVIGWINVCGTLAGSPSVAWLLERRLPTLIYRFLFWRRGRDFQFIRDLDRRPPGPLDVPLHVPPWLRTVHIVGFPLRRHISTRRMAAWHRRLAPWGPNDGAAVLADSCLAPGAVVPVWGADHFSLDRVDLRALLKRVVTAVVVSEHFPNAPSPAAEAACATAEMP